MYVSSIVDMTQEQLDGLKTCPFCGELPVLKFSLVEGYSIWSVECVNRTCFASPSVHGHGANGQEAIVRWNTRPE